MENLEREYFSIEEGNGEKMFHYHGFTWRNDIRDTWASTELTWCQAPLDDVLAYGILDWMQDKSPEVQQYQQDLDEPELLELVDTYYDGEPGEKLPLDEINYDTPAGHYYAELLIY